MNEAMRVDNRTTLRSGGKNGDFQPTLQRAVKVF
jgi:hypothetical protein